MPIFIALAAMMFVGLSIRPAVADDILVTPGGPITIQDAVDGAVNGDVIILANGIFSRDGDYGVDFIGKAITIRSQNGADAVTIDCGGNDKAFRFTSGESGSSILENITMENGSGNTGGGIFIRDSSPTIRGCVIRGCTAQNGGGGIYIESDQAAAGPTIENCTVTTCSSGSANGGAILVKGGTPTVDNCMVFGNSAANGAGIWVEGETGGITLTECEIYDNVASVDGGGLFANQGNAGVNLTNCVIFNNTAARGGGLRFESSQSFTVTNCTIAENTGSTDGAGVYVNGNGSFNKTIIAHNIGPHGATCAGGNPSLNCCVVFNPPDDIEGACFNFLGPVLQQNPEFCGGLDTRYYYLQSDSPAAPGNSPGCDELMGAFPVFCQTTPTKTMNWGSLKSLYR